MANRPTDFPEFASADLNNGTGGAPNVVAPSAGKKSSGWDEGERPARETFNWLHRTTNEWLEYLDDQLSSAGVGINFAIDTGASSGLTLAVGPGLVNIAGVVVEIPSITNINLPANNTSLIWYDVSGNGIDDDLESVTDLSDIGSEGDVALYRVTTDGSTVTQIEDLRTWATIGSGSTSLLDVHQIHTAGQSERALVVPGADASLLPDVRDYNTFIIRPAAAVSNFSINTPSGVGDLDPDQTHRITFLVELTNASQMVTFSSLFDFADGSPSQVFSGTDYGTVMVFTAQYDPADNSGQWKSVNHSRAPWIQSAILDGSNMLNFQGRQGQDDFSVDLSPLDGGVPSTDSGVLVGTMIADFSAGGPIESSRTRVLVFPLADPAGQDVADPTNYFVRSPSVGPSQTMGLGQITIGSGSGPAEMAVETSIRTLLSLQLVVTGPRASIEVTITQGDLAGDPDAVINFLNVQLFRLRGPY